MDSTIYYTVWHVVYIGILIPTVMGNGLIILSILRFRKLRCNMHVLIGNLAVSDLIVGVVLIPADLFSDIYKAKKHKYVCLGIFAIFVLSLGSSCYNLMLISIERYITIAYPLKSHLILTKWKLYFLVALGWVLTTISGSIPLFGLNTFTNSTANCLVEEAWTKGYRINSDWQVIIALLLNVGFYSVVVRVALKKSTLTSQTPGQYNFASRRNVKDLYQLFTMVIVLGTFMVCWLPFVCMSFIVTIWDTPYYQFVKRCSLIPGLMNSGLNWIIYGYRKKEFRQAFVALLKCKRLLSVHEARQTACQRT